MTHQRSGLFDPPYLSTAREYRTLPIFRPHPGVGRLFVYSEGLT